jgi:hypothetical protein
VRFTVTGRNSHGAATIRLEKGRINMGERPRILRRHHRAPQYTGVGDSQSLRGEKAKTKNTAAARTEIALSAPMLAKRQTGSTGKTWKKAATPMAASTRPTAKSFNRLMPSVPRLPAAIIADRKTDATG